MAFANPLVFITSPIGYDQGMAHDVRKSKKLSWLLRHGAKESGLAMDAAGWCDASEVMKKMGLGRDALEELVRTNNKRRLELKGQRIRACQGHSAGTPVERDALEASWELWNSTESVWHGTSRAALQSVARQGLLPQKRTHVHLTESKDSSVAKRAHVEVTLEIDPRLLHSLGTKIHRAPNGVLLARRVHPSCIVALHPLTRRTRRDVAELRRLFGFERS